MGEGVKRAHLLQLHFSLLRSDEKFTIFYDDVVKSSEGLTDKPILPRYRRGPKQMDDGAQPHQFIIPNDRYHQAYFVVIEQACGEIENRFDQSDLSVLSNIESLLINAANGSHWENKVSLN